MKNYFFKKKRDLQLTKKELEDMNSFHNMLLKMKKKRPDLNIERLMKLTYSENNYRLYNNSK